MALNTPCKKGEVVGIVSELMWASLMAHKVLILVDICVYTRVCNMVEMVKL